MDTIRITSSDRSPGLLVLVVIEILVPLFLRHTATILTNRFGITITFFIVLPSRNGLTFSELIAAASNSASVALTGTFTTSRSFPLTWTGTSMVFSKSQDGSNFGQGA